MDLARCIDKPLVLADVGAVGGLKAPWKSIAAKVNALSFEPRSETPLALSDKVGSAVLHVTEPGDGSSLLKPNLPLLERLATMGRYREVSEMHVELDTLDGFIEKNHSPWPDFIKVDTQGTELNILRGAEKALEHAIGVEVEVNFYERYIGAAHFDNVDAFLRERGFWLFDVQRRYSKSRSGALLGGTRGQLTHGNALYFRSPGSVQKDRGETLALCAALYGYIDYAVEILSKVGTPPSSELGTVLQREQASSLSTIDFPGRYRLAHLFKKISEALSLYSSSGSAGDETLGNL